MNDFQNTLWMDLMTLVDESEAFYFSDQKSGDEWYRIFNYRLASYTEFMRQNGTECRGHMFRISEEGYNAQPVEFVTLPMEKFWNLHECPATMGLDMSTVEEIWNKLDGSLISTYVDSHGTMYLKSKGSLASDQALAAMAWMSANPDFYDCVYHFVKDGFTVNMEWCAPDNRIVIGYLEASLRVLNVRNNQTGKYVSQYIVEDMFKEWAVEPVDVDQTYITMQEFIESIPDMQKIEGFVIRLASGQRVKIKTTWYLALHHTKDNINSPRRLFEAVLEEATDDMRMLFHDDPLAIKTIQEMEDFVSEKYNHMVDMVERFYKRNKALTRKEYAILGQTEFAGTFYFGLAMNKYIEREFSYKDFLKGKWKQLGLKDVEKESD